MMPWRQIVPTSVTLLAMLCGFMSILFTIQGMQGTDPGQFYRSAALLILLAMILDGLDGNLARWMKGCSEFGSELDTYVDMTAFGLAPAVLIYAVTVQGGPLWVKVLLPSAVALSGVVRLARFKVKDPLRGQGGYSGLPITANAAWVSLFVFIALTPPKDQFHGKVAALFLVGVIVFIILQVTNLRYPKPTKDAFLFAACVLMVLLIFLLPKPWDARAASCSIILGIGYVVFGPLFVKSVKAHRARKESLANAAAQDKPPYRP